MTPQEIAILVGVLLPILIRFVKQEHFTAVGNSIVAVAVYVVVGVATLVFSGDPINAANLVLDVGVVAGAGTAAYQLFWKNTEGDPAPAPTTVAVFPPTS